MNNFNQIWIFINLLLIVLVFIRIPKDNDGLIGVTDSMNVLGVSIRVQKNLDILIGIFVLLYTLLLFFN